MTILDDIKDRVAKIRGDHHRSHATVKQVADPVNTPRPLSKGEIERALHG